MYTIILKQLYTISDQSITSNSRSSVHHLNHLKGGSKNIQKEFI